MQPDAPWGRDIASERLNRDRQAQLEVEKRRGWKGAIMRCRKARGMIMNKKNGVKRSDHVLSGSEKDNNDYKKEKDEEMTMHSRRVMNNNK